MRIVFVVPNLNFSGGIEVIKRHCVELNKLGHQAEMWYPFLKYRGYNYPYSKCYFREHQIPKADVIIATAWETASIVNRLPKDHGRKMYFIQHYEQWEYHNGGEKKEEIEDTYSMPLEHIYVSDFIRKHISPLDHNHVVHNGVDWHHDITKDFSEPRILYPKRQERWKGNETLDIALGMLEADYPDVEVKSYGDPFVDRKTFHNLFEWANIFLFPSWIEGFGLPPLEAASYACAVVSTTSNAMPELFAHDEMIWCKPKCADDLYDGARFFIESEDERRRVGYKAQARADMFTPEKATEELLKCLQ